MIAHAQAKFLRGSPRKVGLVLDLIRGKGILESESILAHLNKGCSQMIRKALHSAVSNAKQKGLIEEQLVISKVTADQGPSWKRYRAASFGRASPILKRTTHLTIELDLKVGQNRNPSLRVDEAKSVTPQPATVTPPRVKSEGGTGKQSKQNKPSKKRMVAK